MKDVWELVKELRGKRCRCGAKKRERETFCKSCYYSLPGDKRHALYARIGAGYEGAYASAVEYLEQLEAEIKEKVGPV